MFPHSAKIYPCFDATFTTDHFSGPDGESVGRDCPKINFELNDI